MGDEASPQNLELILQVLKFRDNFTHEQTWFSELYNHCVKHSQVHPKELNVQRFQDQDFNLKFYPHFPHLYFLLTYL